MKTTALIAEYIESMRKMKLADVDELMRGGVPIEAIALVCPAPTRISRIGKQYYEPATAGHRAWIVPVATVERKFPELIETDDPKGVIGGANVVDIVAFTADAPAELALRTGLGAVLGAIPPQYFNPPPVRVHRGVIGWLKAGCDGIVLLTDDPHEAGRILRQVDRIKPEEGDDEHYELICELVATVPMALHTVVERGDQWSI